MKHTTKASVRSARRQYQKKAVNAYLLRQATNPDVFDVNFKSRRGKLARIIHVLWNRLEKDPRVKAMGVGKQAMINQYEIARAARHAIADAARAALG